MRSFLGAPRSPIEVLALGLDIVKPISGFPLPLPAGSFFLPGAHVETPVLVEQRGVTEYKTLLSISAGAIRQS